MRYKNKAMFLVIFFSLILIGKLLHIHGLIFIFFHFSTTAILVCIKSLASPYHFIYTNVLCYFSIILTLLCLFATKLYNEFFFLFLLLLFWYKRYGNFLCIYYSLSFFLSLYFTIATATYLHWRFYINFNIFFQQQYMVSY